MLKSFQNVPRTLNVSKYVKLPEKFKGTIVERWANYWKNLFIDYRQMLKDLRTDIQDDPRRALKWTVYLSSAFILAKNNPSEHDFYHAMKCFTNDIILVSEDCQNPKSISHIRYLESCSNQKVLHYQSLGILSIMYRSEFSEECNMYRAQCSYVAPTYAQFPSRIIDIGLLGKWWNIYIKSADYDVNYENKQHFL